MIISDSKKMEHYIICVTDSESGCLERLLESRRGQSVTLPVTYISAWTVDGQSCIKSSDNRAENINTGGLWLRVNEACMGSDRDGVPDDQSASPSGIQSEGRFLLAEKLHQAADSLPSHGCCVDVIISLSDISVQAIQSESLVVLYACLKRLRVWHGAAIKLVVCEESCARDHPLLDWRNHLQAEVVRTFEDSAVQSNITLWRGQAVVLDSRGNVLLCLRDMCLECSFKAGDEKMETGNPEVRLGLGVTQMQQAYIRSRNLLRLSLSQTLKVLEEVDLLTVPSFLLSPCRLHLKQKGGISVNEFLQHVHSNSEVGYILRLSYVKNSEVKASGLGLRSTKHWKETLSANPASIFDVVESEEMVDGHVHLLLTAGHRSTPASPGSPCMVYILRSAEEINGGIIEVLHKNWLKNPALEDVGDIDIGSMIQSLPIWNLSELECFTDYVVRAQRHVLQAWLDERRSRGQSVCMAETELMSILQDVHRHVLEVTESERLEQAETIPHKPYSLWTYPREASDNVDWPERQALKLQESSLRKMSRFVSSESLLQSSPIQPGEEAEKSVNVGDFLKLFAADGSAAGTDLSILQGKEGGRVLSKISSFDDCELSWPECKDVKFHDIYYNNSHRCEKLELQYCKLKQRQLGSETRSTISVSSSGVLDHSCSTLKSKVVQKISRSPVRRSPRKHALPRDRLSSRVIRDKRRIELCPKPSSDLGVKQNLSGDSFTQLTADRPVRGPTEDRKKTAYRQRVMKEDMPPAEAPASDQTAEKKKSSRSDRHKRRLQQIVHDVLKAKGVRSGEDLYKACSTKLYTVTKLYAMELPTSRNLVADMTKIAEGQVQQVIDLEMMKRKSSQNK